MSVVRGWCPTAWRPMAAGDGLLVRVRPSLGRVTREQMLGLCMAASRYGNGQIDVTNRANLQIRGVAEGGWKPLVATLVTFGLVDPDPIREARRAIIVTPEWTTGDDTHRIATELELRLAELPNLPGKVGFAIDAGPAPVLSTSPGDFRIEHGIAGGLMLRAEGRDAGMALPHEGEVDAIIALAEWFVATGGREAGRMARHHTPLPGWANGTDRPAPSAASLVPGSHPLGSVQALAFGRIDAERFAANLRSSDARAVRTTPWRTLLVEGADAIGDTDALIDVDACVGAPACPQGTVETRALATRLAPFVTGRLHVSGCAKGCARTAAADVMLTGRDGRYDLAFGGRADAMPVRAGFDASQVLAYFGAA